MIALIATLAILAVVGCYLIRLGDKVADFANGLIGYGRERYRISESQLWNAKLLGAGITVGAVIALVIIGAWYAVGAPT